MSESEDYNSAKDEDFDEPADAESASDDEPLSKTKKTKDVGKKTKSPKKNGKSPKKAGRPPGKGRKSGPVKEAAKEGKRGRGRPPASATKTKKAEKPAKVSFSDDPLALSENEEDPLNNDDEDEVEDEYEVTTIDCIHFRRPSFNFAFLRSRQSLGTANTTASWATRSAGKTTTPSTIPGKTTARFAAQIC